MSFAYKRRRRGTEDQHVDDWLMTYADMITLLLCFFAIFLSVSMPKEDKVQEASKKVLEQFAKPDALAGKFPSPETSGMPRSDSKMPYQNMPSIVDQFEGKNNMEIKKGDRIISIDMNSAPLFGSGSAMLSEEGGKMLMDVVTIVNDEQFRDYRVTVEGHTDDAPISTVQFPSNWELSTARASAVVRFLIGNGVRADRLRAEGFADTAPKLPNRDASGRPLLENQAQNRRVVVKLERIDPDQPEE
jgi:chemotaxis protein MotB